MILKIARDSRFWNRLENTGRSVLHSYLEGLTFAGEARRE